MMSQGKDILEAGLVQYEGGSWFALFTLCSPLENPDSWSYHCLQPRGLSGPTLLCLPSCPLQGLVCALDQVLYLVSS